MSQALRNYLAAWQARETGPAARPGRPGPAPRRRLRYGRHDCLILVAGWVRLATGRDLLEGQRYTSLRDGRRRLAQYGLADHVALIAGALPEIAVLQGRAGDVAVLDGGHGSAAGPALGLVAPGGEHIAAFTPQGLALVPLTAARRMFRGS